MEISRREKYWSFKASILMLKIQYELNFKLGPRNLCCSWFNYFMNEYSQKYGVSFLFLFLQDWAMKVQISKYLF